MKDTHGGCRQSAPRSGAVNSRKDSQRRPGALPCLRLMRIAVGGVIGILQAPLAVADNPAEALEVLVVEVIGTTPLPGLVTPIRDVNDTVVMQTAVIGEADILCTKDRDFFETPAEEFLRRAGIAVLDDISLMHRLRS